MDRRPRRGFFPGPWPRRGAHRRAASRSFANSSALSFATPNDAVTLLMRSPLGSMVHCLDSRTPRIRSTAVTASTRRAPGKISANSSPPKRATLSCPRTFCTRMLANSRNRRSPTRWPKRSLTCLELVDIGKREANVVAEPSRLLHLLHEAGVEETAIADRGHDVAQPGVFRAFEVCLQLHDLEARLFELVPDVVEPVAHVAIVLDEGQHDLLDRAHGFVPRQALVVAVESLGKALAVGHMGLQHLCDLAQHPVDLFVLVLSSVSRRAVAAWPAALGWTWRGP